jgi:hypothetical protein
MGVIILSLDLIGSDSCNIYNFCRIESQKIIWDDFFQNCFFLIISFIQKKNLKQDGQDEQDKNMDKECFFVWFYPEYPVHPVLMFFFIS